MLQRGAVRRSDYQSYQTARATEGDRARGISAERFEIPLAGGVAASVPASAVGWRATCAAWGEPARPGFPPEGETGKGEINCLAAAGGWRPDAMAPSKGCAGTPHGVHPANRGRSGRNRLRTDPPRFR